MNELQIFNNEEFGQVRIMEVDGTPMFVANDVAKALGYSNPSKATNDHCKKAIKIWGNDSLGRRQEFKVIPEGDMYRLITHSKLESAERFEQWVFDEVLLSLRKTGTYEMPKKEKQDNPKKKNLSATNMLIKNISGIFKDAGVSPVFIAAEAKRLYKEQADIEINIPLITDESAQTLWDCTSIAKELGILSESGRPHDKAVSAIIQKLDIFTDEEIKTAYSRNGHDGITVQYKETVLHKAKEWLEENHYPSVVELELANGNVYKCRVVYREVA